MEEPIVVTVESIGARLDSFVVGQYNIVISAEQIAEAFEIEVKDDTVLVVTLEDQRFELSKDVASGDWMIAGDLMLAAEDEAAVKLAVISLKK